MASKLSATLDGSLLVQLSPGVCNAPVDPGQAITIGLITANRTGDEQVGQQLATVESPAAFVALPYPAALLGRVLYFRGLGDREVWSVRLTYAVSAQTVLQIQGTTLMEVPQGDEITAVEVQGSGEISWLVWGTLA